MNNSVDEAESIKLLVELFNKGKSHCMVLSSMCRKPKAKKQTTTKKKERKKDKQKNTQPKPVLHMKINTMYTFADIANRSCIIYGVSSSTN